MTGALGYYVEFSMLLIPDLDTVTRRIFGLSIVTTEQFSFKCDINDYFEYLNMCNDGMVCLKVCLRLDANTWMRQVNVV